MNLFKSFILIVAIFIRPSYGMSHESGFSSSNNIHFNSLTVNNGLSQNSITSIIQDAKGLIWIASYDGLNRFDGFTMLVKRYDSKSPNSLSENRILCMAEHIDGNIWLGTDGGGVNVYHSDNEKFSRYNSIKGDIPDDNILCISADKQGNMWLGTEKGLLKATVTDNDSVTFEEIGELGIVSRLLCDNRGSIWIVSQKGLHVISHKSIKATITIARVNPVQDPYINTLFCDRFNNIWVSTYNSLFRISDAKEFEHDFKVTNVYAAVFSKPTVEVRAMTEDRDHNIWIGTEQSGLVKLSLNPAGEIVNKTVFSTDVPFCNISDNRIRALFVDRTNVLWIGFHKKGVNYSDICGKRFHLLYDLCSPVRNELGYKGKFISSACSDSRDRIWLINEEEGIYVHNRETQKTVYLEGFPHHETISSFMESKSGDIWLGGMERLFKIDKQHSDAGLFDVKEIFQYPLSGNIRTLCEDKYGDIWFGSTTGKGLYRYTPHTGECQLYEKNNGFSATKLFYLLPDKEAPVIWVSTLYNGFMQVKYNDKDKKIITSTYTTSGTFALNSNHIWHTYPDQFGNLWIGTDAGLNKVELDNARNITSISSIDVPLLNGIKIMSITEDKEHNFWLNCSQGLYCFNPQTEEVQIYTHQDGLQSNTFTEASTITPDGWIYTGGINGINYFLPAEIKKNPYPSEVAIVNLRIHEKTVKPGEFFDKRQILKKDINSTCELVLDYKSNNFMFEFVAIHYAVSNKNQFLYKLEGFDKNWIQANANLRVAAYSNLPAGHYVFKIKSSNNDGVWSDAVKEIKVTILPPPWKTTWAYLLYTLCAIGLIYFVIHYLLTKQRLRHELYIERIENEKIKELNEMKMGFFTNITHEFRTPLVLILSPLKDLMSDIKYQNKHVRLRLQIINRNATRLLSLINQTLDIRKISSETMKLLITKNNLHNHIENMIESFDVLTTDRHVSLEFTNELEADIQWYDKYKIDKVLLNILSNAVKYTPPKGLIQIHVHQTKEKEKESDYAVVSIKDSGKGIPPEEINRIFELFYQAKNSTIEGTGIGLSYVKSLLEIHRGGIRVESEPGSGTCFTFHFPIDKASYIEEQISETIDLDFNTQGMRPFIEEEMDDEIPADEEGALEASESEESLKKILIVEDNVDLRMYIKDCLTKHYDVVEASNGVAAIKVAKKEQPDLIITDIMMPLMDGIEFCKTLKTDIHTRHIPIFIHSVKSDEIVLKEAMDAGAEDFIAKPYNYATLIKKIRNFFQTREQLVTRAQAEVMLKPSEIELPSSDDELTLKISRIIEQNLSNPEFGVEALAEQVGLSRMQLHRRVIAITGSQTSTLIRDIRLQRAAQLLKSGEKRISEVMWETGFNNHSRFNKYFKLKFGVAVKDYIRQNT